MSKKNNNKRPKLGRVSVRSERKQPPDWDKFAWTVLQYARLKAEAERQRPESK